MTIGTTELTPGTAIIDAIVALYASVLVCWIAGCIIGVVREGIKRWRAGQLKPSANAPRSDIE